MAEFLSQRLLGRLAAILFVLSGLVSMANLLVPQDRQNPWFSAIASASAVAVGLVAWYLPWQRWPRSATLPLAVVGFLLITAGAMANLKPWAYSVYWVVCFVWIGVAQPKWTALKLLPVALAGYVLPMIVRRAGSDALVSAGVVMPVCLLVSESLAWISGKLRQAERLDIRRMSDMESLLNATVSLARQVEPGGAANLVAELAVRLLRADRSIVLLTDASTGTLRGIGGFRWRGQVQNIEAGWIDEPAREALATGEPIVHDGGVCGRLTKAAGGASVLFLPLTSAAGALGLVMVTYPSGSSADLDSFATGMARTFATQASLAFERLRATQVLVDESLRDALTGVGNRRRADAMLESLRAGDAVALLDLDHFKGVNDRYGHATGDDVLVALASYLDDALRDGDEVARYGGEEFLVVVRQAGEHGRSAIERLAAGWNRMEPLATFSAGVADHEAGQEPSSTMASADTALYWAKSDGRDCVRRAGDQQNEASNTRSA